MDVDEVLIVGTGAMATLIGGRLSGAGISVTMLGTWMEAIQTLRDGGINIVGEGRTHKVHATNEPRECVGIRNTIVLVKSWQTQRVAEQLSACVPDDGVVLTLQNGLGNFDTLKKGLGARRVLQGVTTSGASLIAPGKVVQAGKGFFTLEENPGIHPMANAIRKAGFLVNIESNVRSLIWGKLVVTSALNPVSALLKMKNGELLKNTYSMDLMNEIASETAAIAARQDIPLPFRSPAAVVKKVAWQTRGNRSSMYQDILRGSPTEIDAINGAISRLAAQYGMDAPYNKSMWYLVSSIPVHGKIKI